MKEKILRFFGIMFSVFFLIASLGIIFWITQDEQERLALREKAGLASVNDLAAENAKKQAEAEVLASFETADKTLNDIDALLSALSIDDLPSED